MRTTFRANNSLMAESSPPLVNRALSVALGFAPNCIEDVTNQFYQVFMSFKMFEYVRLLKQVWNTPHHLYLQPCEISSCDRYMKMA